MVKYEEYNESIEIQKEYFGNALHLGGEVLIHESN